MNEVRIVGLGTYLPKQMHTNETLPALDPPMTKADMDRIGVLRRGWASDEESVAMMGVTAARRALEQAQIEPSSIDFIVLANWSERRYVPDFAPLIQAALGAKSAFAYDVGCACAGFVYGLSMAHGFLQNSRFRRGLVLASDQSTRRIRPRSRGTLVFGDGAGCMVLERGAERGGRLIDYELTSDGTRNDIMSVDKDGYLKTHIKQADLNALAGRSIGAVSRALLARNQLTFDDVTWIVPHSGTAGVQAMVAENLGVSSNKILTNLPLIGNVTTASIPTALAHFVAEGKIKPGDLVLSASVGLGWHAVAALYTL
ncbi:MAG: ketoacyl-ACP synthase III [Polyangiaceae bacterium]